MRKIKSKSQKKTPILVRDVHVFVDFLLNQKDGRSFVILPELISPNPFLYGTLSKNEAVVYGPDAHSNYILKITGQVLPSSVENVVKTLGNLYGSQAVTSVSNVVAHGTENLCMFPFTSS